LRAWAHQHRLGGHSQPIHSSDQKRKEGPSTMAKGGCEEQSRVSE
jgi:hypothetical protein